MPISRRIEMVFGLLTGGLARIAAFTVTNLKPPRQFFLISIFYIVPALLVALGSCLDAIGDMKSGRRVLFAGGIILLMPWIPGFMGTSYAYGLLGGLLVLTPGVMIAQFGGNLVCSLAPASRVRNSLPLVSLSLSVRCAQAQTSALRIRRSAKT